MSEYLAEATREREELRELLDGRARARWTRRGTRSARGPGEPNASARPHGQNWAGYAGAPERRMLRLHRGGALARGSAENRNTPGSEARNAVGPRFTFSNQWEI
jgi:hypothetical protein